MTSPLPGMKREGSVGLRAPHTAPHTRCTGFRWRKSHSLGALLGLTLGNIGDKLLDQSKGGIRRKISHIGITIYSNLSLGYSDIVLIFMDEPLNCKSVSRQYKRELCTGLYYILI